MLSIPGVACNQVWYERIAFYNSNFSIPNGSASVFGRVFLKEISSKMTSISGHGRPRQERLSVALSVAPLDSFLPLESSDKLSAQPVGPSVTKPPVADTPVAATNVPKYSEDDLQRIFKAVLETQTPASASVPAPVVFEIFREKLKACSSDVYYGKSHMDCYNFCHQYENYFATIGAMRPIQIFFAPSYFWVQINFH